VRRVIALLVVLVASLAFAENPKGAKYEPPKPAKSFRTSATVKVPPGKSALLALRGRVVLLTIVETYNTRCADAVPDMNGLHDRLGPRGLTLLALFHEEEKDAVEKWIATTGFKGSAAIVDTQDFEKVIQREYQAPGYPWSFVIDAKGALQRHDHPSGLQDAWLEPYLDEATQPPLLPETLADAQKELDAGAWAKAKAALQAARDGGKLSKVDAGWAQGVSRWIELRRSRTIPEGDKLEAEGWHWDAWWVFDDFTRRFEGMEGVDVARQKADAIRASTDKAVEEDLKQGDDLVKAKEHLAKKTKQGNEAARFTLTRMTKLKTRFGERAAELLATVPPK
jgi:hypothetical protein